LNPRGRGAAATTMKTLAGRPPQAHRSQVEAMEAASIGPVSCVSTYVRTHTLFDDCPSRLSCANNNQTLCPHPACSQGARAIDASPARYRTSGVHLHAGPAILAPISHTRRPLRPLHVIAGPPSARSASAPPARPKPASRNSEDGRRASHRGSSRRHRSTAKAALNIITARNSSTEFVAQRTYDPRRTLQIDFPASTRLAARRFPQCRLRNRYCLAVPPIERTPRRPSGGSAKRNATRCPPNALLRCRPPAQGRRDQQGPRVDKAAARFRSCPEEFAGAAAIAIHRRCRYG